MKTLGASKAKTTSTGVTTTTTTNASNITKLVELLGHEVNKMISGTTVCPVQVYTITSGTLGFQYQKNERFDDPARTYTGFQIGGVEASKEPELGRCYVGYDIEFITGEEVGSDGIKKEPRLLSHQFYFAYNGERKGVILLTDIRLTEDALVTFIAEAVPDGTAMRIQLNKKFKDVIVPIKNVYLCAHYSHAEAGWLTTGRLREMGEARRDEDMHLKPVEWLCEEMTRRLEYFDKNKKEASEKELRRPLVQLLRKRERKWVGRIPLFKRKEVERYKNINADVVAMHQPATKTARDRERVIEALVLKHVGGEDIFKGFVRNVMAAGKIANLGAHDKTILKTWTAACIDELYPETLFPKGAPGRVKRTLHMADSMDLMPTSLASIGEMIKIDKIELGEGVISEMDQLLIKDRQLYLQYAMRDSIVTVETVAFYAQLFWTAEKLPLQIRAAAYSSKLFTETFKKFIVPKVERDISHKQLLGWEYRLDENGKATDAMWPSAAMESYAQFYFGGWAASHVVGPRANSVYHDLKSAFPCAIGMLGYDYNFGEARVYRGAWAKKFIDEELMPKGPFQIAGVCCSFRFREKHQLTERPVEPIFPVKVDKTWLPPMSIAESEGILLFPRAGYAHVAWPEFYTAYKDNMHLLESCEIHHVVTFEILKETDSSGKRVRSASTLAKETLRLIEARGIKGNKAIYKALLNNFYGKSAEGIRKKSVVNAKGVIEQKRLPGALTCFPIASYTTSVCRACIGELLQSHECYGIATDGFISPDKDVIYGEICSAVQAKIGNFIDYNETYYDANGDKCDGWKDDNGVIHAGKPYDFIETDFTSEEGLFLKSRGYALVGTDSDSGKVKLAQMGIQIEERDKKSKKALDEFLQRLIAGKYIKKSSRALPELKKDGKDELPLKRESETMVNSCYDFKRIPVVSSLVDTEFTFEGETFKCVQFDTKPLESVEDFVLLRQLSRGYKKMTAAGYRAIMDRFYKTGFGLNPL